MRKLKHLFDKNREWSERVNASDPEFFDNLSRQQTPNYLWIGCADSRVPANEITGLMPGEMFVHRNVANLVVHTDLNCLSVIQYAVEVLQVKHIIVCGHYGCGGVLAAMENKKHGLIDNWLRHIQDVAQKHETQLAAITDTTQKFQRLCELNIIEQVSNVCQTTVVDNAWERGQDLTVHAWIYGLHNGLLQDLNLCVTSADDLRTHYRTAITTQTSV
jgi:carbonic anhydrase